MNKKTVSVRALAVSVLGSVLTQNVHPKDAMEEVEKSLDARDRAFLMELVYGSLRNIHLIDYLLSGFLDNPERLKTDTQNNMRAGVYQLFYMRAPEWAVVDEAVTSEARQKGLVNAVLRNVIRKKAELSKSIEELTEAATDSVMNIDKRIEAIAVVKSHPIWLIKRWAARYGIETAFELASANNNIAPLTLRVNRLKSDRDTVMERLKGLGMDSEKTRYSPDGIRLELGADFRNLGDLADIVTVQDEAAQLVGRLISPKKGERVLDACSAPGGKCTHMAELMEDAGEIVALDTSQFRINKMKENIDRLGLRSIRTIKADALDVNDDIGEFDSILLDAPCSSIGVIRRNPDVRFRHTSKDLIKNREVQVGLLNHLSRFLKKGGVMVYAVCSTEPEEGEDVISEFLKTHPDYYIIDDEKYIPKELLEGGFMRTYPHRDDMDGFFGARLQRR